jgi:hypothetical protein
MQWVFETYSGVLFASLMFAVLFPAIGDALDTARRAQCTNNLWMPGRHGDVVYLERGRIVRVWSSRWSGGRTGQIEFVEENDGQLVPREQALRDGFAVFMEALDRLRQYRLDSGWNGFPTM